MDATKYSALLKELTETAVEIGGKPNTPLTAERFVIAAIDVLKHPAGRYSKEFTNLRKIVKGRVRDLDVARERLMAYIDRSDAEVYLDDLYMRGRMEQAAAYAEEQKLTQMDTICVMTALIDEPSDALKEIFEYDGKAAEPVAAAPAAPAPAEPEQTPAAPVQEEKKGGFQLDLELLQQLVDSSEGSASTPSQQPKEEATPGSTKSEISQLVADVKRIRTELQSTVFGQDNAINVFTTGYFQACLLALTDKGRQKPKATFLFAGPPGVGKTFLAETIANSLQLPCQRFDMSEYADKEANLEFCGSDKVYKNGKCGNVTGFVAKNPRCVLLFDEIEKAHTCVIHLFLQMLDAGRLRDNYTDEEVSFSEAIIILTTNAGRQLYEESESGDLSNVSRKVIIKALQKDVNPATNQPFFPGAICSRFASGNVVMFNHMSAHNLRAIAKKEIQRHATALETETGIKLQIEEPVYTALLLSEGSAADARTIRARAESFFNDELYELLRLIASEKVKTDIDTLEEIKVTVDTDGTKPEIRTLFMTEEKPRVLLFSAPEMVEQCQKKAPAMEFVGVQEAEKALSMLKTQEFGFVLLDMKYGAEESPFTTLNLEDIQSPARDFFKKLRQMSSLPIYLLEEKSAPLSEEEVTSFQRQGVRGVIQISKGKDSFGTEMEEIASQLHQQASMIRLAMENKLVSFETAQTVSRNGKVAQIRLFDFQMAVAVDAEDSKNILSAVSKPNVRFADVIGAEDAKKELTYFVEYLKNPKKYMGTGVKAPRGVILYGPPGTGKTMLAKAMACEAGVTFIAAEGNQFLKRYVGEGPEKVHELFKTARKYAPSILFIDEIDAIAKERKGSGEGGSNEEGTLTAFLAEMDGFANDPSKPVFVLAATNFEVQPGTDKSLDPALMRRFDRRVYIDLPDKPARILFMQKKIAKNPSLRISRTQVENLAVRATGMSLAELDSVFELALRSAIREGSTTVTDAILEEAFETFNGGEAKKWDISLLERVARHESGHAFLYWLDGATPSYLTIVARGNHGGYMQRSDREEKELFTREELLARIRTSLGGRAAEIVYYGQDDGISTGASGDLTAATRTAQQLVCVYGMDEDFGMAVVNGQTAAYGEMSMEVRAVVNRILREQLALAVQLIADNKAKMDALVDELMAQNHMNGEEIERVLSSTGGPVRIKKN